MAAGEEQSGLNAAIAKLDYALEATNELGKRLGELSPATMAGITIFARAIAARCEVGLGVSDFCNTVTTALENQMAQAVLRLNVADA